ncbi:hypothetical protein K7X08_033949 [Anisodus acutangulus]|uniref:Uncharacterized protein n=1 Tax=Anisodus acutangulus TaxID=402998 RepID=A0A9Q1MJC0_9SOLA|nr:hypothetical protein K7X08_033949 [Anisodus acutangulus]
MNKRDNGRVVLRIKSTKSAPRSSSNLEKRIRVAAQDLDDVVGHDGLWAFIVPWRGSTKKLVSEDEKDQRIRELTIELYNERQRYKRRCAAYQEQLQTLLKIIEDHTDHLSISVEEAVQRVKELDYERLEDSD